MEMNELGEVLFEMTRIGGTIRVTAVHARTGTEAVIQGPAHYPATLLKRNALKKLIYVLSKEDTKR
jgi:hypothetical protein